MTSIAPYASHADQSRGRQHSFPPDPAEIRNEFQRDRDRIIHSSAFRKLKYKTQVFVYHEGDYYRTRLTHSLEVAQVARVICRHLNLNEDLGEAVALAHDLGHTAFGHAGETELNNCMKEYGGFDHNEQTVRVVTMLEQYYEESPGLNLTWETLEGVAKHNGPMSKENARPTIAGLCRSFNIEFDTYPSLEAQIANLADDIAYIAHDFDDGIRSGLINPDDLSDLPLVSDVIPPAGKKFNKSVLVNTIRRKIITAEVTGLIAETERRLKALNPKDADAIRGAGHPVAAFTKSTQQDLKDLRAFLRQSFWRHDEVIKMTDKAQRILRDLFDFFIEDTSKLPDEWQYIGSRHLDAVDKTDKARHIADYIASMTDRYAMLKHKKLFDLEPIIEMKQ